MSGRQHLANLFVARLQDPERWIGYPRERALSNRRLRLADLAEQGDRGASSVQDAWIQVLAYM